MRRKSRNNFFPGDNQSRFNDDIEIRSSTDLSSEVTTVNNKK